MVKFKAMQEYRDFELFEIFCLASFFSSLLLHSQYFYLHDCLSFLFNFATSILISFTLLISDVVRGCHNAGLSNVRVFFFFRFCARKIFIRINIDICVERNQIYYQKTALCRCVIRYLFASPYFRFFILFSSSETKRKWTVQCRCAAHCEGCKACVTVTLLDEDESDDEEDEPPRELSGSENKEKPEDKSLKSIVHNGESHT